MIHAPTDRAIDARLLALPFAVTAVIAGYMVRMWFLQIVQASELQERAEVSSIAVVKKLAPRGRIVDRAGRLLAGVEPRITVLARPRTAMANPAVVDRVAAILQIEPQALKKAIRLVPQAGDLAVPVYIGADVAMASKIAELSDELPGFSVETQGMRSYSAGPELGHIMGYVRPPRDDDNKRLKAQGIDPAQYVGLQGIERQYERDLMGRPGTEKVAVDARRKAIRSLGSDEAVAGSTLVLSLDLRLQRTALGLLQGHKGSVVMIDPNDGGVLCLASNPTFDSSVFLKGISKDEYAALAEDESRPLFFRAVSGAYAPGSTFKLVITLAAMSSGVFDPNESVYCPGYVLVGRKKVACKNHPNETVAFDRAFTKSCNAYFGQLARKIGRENILKTCDALGIGRPSEIDLPSQSRGVLPTVDWWAKHRDRRWSLGDTVNLGIGQGELTTTPLQMAEVGALIANRGVCYRPHIVRAVKDPEGSGGNRLVPAEVLSRLDLPAHQWDTLTSAMVHVIEVGTARTAQIGGLLWGGKTGSAENLKDHNTHSWFVGVAPIESPKVVICVMLENAGHGGDVAAPIAAKMVREYLNGKAAPRVEVQSSRMRDSAASTLDAEPESPDRE
ncbi:MAG: penicillin-binding protein 2 [Armatimonadetes bacterium]|nr:penicillin-binding protein 2 [Armatimonadota bacterium]